MVELQLLEEDSKNKILIILLSFLFFYEIRLFADNKIFVEFECLSETRVSGLYQNERKFLKDSEFFPYKTIMSFSDNYEILSESDNSYKKNTESKYKFHCKKNENSSLITCDPVGAVKAYQVWFSLETLRYRKSLLTDFWIEGKGNEIDYAHLSLGYCYRINN